MCSIFKNQLEVDSIKQSPLSHQTDSSQMAEILEDYIGKVNQLQQELRSTKAELSHCKKLHGEMSDSLNEIITIQKASEIITQHLEYDKIVASLLQLCHQAIEFSKGNIYLWVNDRWQPLLDEENNDFECLLNNMLEEGIIDWVWKQNRPIAIPLKEFIVFDQLESKTGNLIVSPLMISRHRLGILMLHSPKKQEDFSLRDLELLNILTLQAAIAIQYTSLYKDLEETHIELEKSQVNLLRAVKLATVGEIAGGVAHEINNPLQIIMGKIQLAKVSEEATDALEIIEMQAMRIATIVRGLLTISKQNGSNRSEYIEVNKLIENTLNLMRTQLEKRGIKIVTDLGDSAPIIVGNSVNLQQILLNFIISSKKRMPSGGLLFVKTGSNPTGWLIIEVRDTGPKLVDKVVANIRDPFSVSGSSQESDAHFGLVVNAQMIYEAGGKIEVDFSSNNENVWMITLPPNQGKSEAP